MPSVGSAFCFCLRQGPAAGRRRDAVPLRRELNIAQIIMSQETIYDYALYLDTVTNSISHLKSFKDIVSFASSRSPSLLHIPVRVLDPRYDDVAVA